MGRKQTLLLISILFLILSIMGCNSEDNMTKVAIPDLSQQNGDIQGEITFWAWSSIEPIKLELPGFYKKYPKVKVNMVTLTHDEAYKRFLLANASNTGAPDVAALSGNYVGQFIQTNALEDLTEFVRPYRNKIIDSKWPDAMKDGDYYAMPWDSGPVALFYRRDLFEKAGLPSDPAEVSKLLSTWDKYVEVGKIIKQKTGSFMQTMPHDSAVGLTTQFEYMLSQEGALYLDNNGKIGVNNPIALKALNLIKQMNADGITMNVEQDTKLWEEALTKGEVATVLQAVWMAGHLKDFTKGMDGKWGIAEMPAWQEEGSRAAEGGGSYMGISKQSKNKKAAWAFIEYMLGNAKTQNSIYKNSDIFPSLKEAYQDPMYDEPMPFFGNQKIRQLFVELSKKAKPIYFSNDFSALRDIATLQMFKALKGQLTTEDALKVMESQMKEKTKRY